MTGTEKQIIWAENIKKNLLNDSAFKNGYEQKLEKEIENKKRAIERGKTNLASYDAKIEDLKKIINFIENQESAEWFIDNRGINNGSFGWDMVCKKFGFESEFVKLFENK